MFTLDWATESSTLTEMRTEYLNHSFTPLLSLSVILRPILGLPDCLLHF